ncbi:thioredoxin family protein [Altererythrobacter confluentis]|uniref:Thioredoxin family protein n=1 Tax=Allopontixanthobacter confluentis TaxID=1849021 RepID=A0A6L7GI30_9SPHN|nr:thioredoxin family protein [Allopontixanthobacter confluentis]MXP15587.1 thioredoxin family protein [Allopontixanthobacter confluentis]
MNKSAVVLLALLGAGLLGSCAAIVDPPMRPSISAHSAPEARAYDEQRNAAADVDAALVRAGAGGKNVLIALGANWCHDSRAFAGWMETPRFAAMLAQRYETVFVDVGNPQQAKGRNLDIARRFGLADIAGTPTVLIVSPDGTVLNAATAPGWRNAASRDEDAIYDELSAYLLP